MDKVHKIIKEEESPLAGTSAAPRVDRASDPADKLIEILTDQICDHVTESLEAVLRAIERIMIIRVLKKTGGNQTQAARLLGVPRTTLISKLKNLNIPDY